MLGLDRRFGGICGSRSGLPGRGSGLGFAFSVGLGIATATGAAICAAFQMFGKRFGLLSQGFNTFLGLFGGVRKLFSQVRDGILDGGRGLFHFFFQALYLVKVHFFLDITFDIIHIALGATQQMPHGTGDLGQTLGPQNDQGNDCNNQKFAKTDIKHRRLPAKNVQASVFSLACTSTVLSSSAVRCAMLSGLSSWASLMPFLKPLTAPPRSSPMLRNFLVPKTKATISNTISQCQILKVPIQVS